MSNTDKVTFSLYHTPHCPYCARVRSAMDALNINVPMHNIFFDANKRKELIKNGGKQQVPCLHITHNGRETWLYESQDIINFLHDHANKSAHAA